MTDIDRANRKIKKEDAIKFARDRKFQGFGECSALKNINIKEIFQSFCRTLYKKNKDKLEEKTIKKINELNILKLQHSNKTKDCCE